MDLKTRFMKLSLNCTTNEKGCKLWQGTRCPKGYGRIKEDSLWKRAHRVSYEVHVGPIPNGLDILHSCDERNCINPKHLRPGTNDDNVRDAQERRRHAAKLSPEKIKEIRYLRSLGVSRQKIADRFGVCHDTVWDVDLGITWKWVK